MQSNIANKVSRERIKELMELVLAARSDAVPAGTLAAGTLAAGTLPAGAVPAGTLSAGALLSDESTDLRDIGFRSLDFSELALRVEEEFGSELNFDAPGLRAVRTVGDVLDLLVELQSG